MVKTAIFLLFLLGTSFEVSADFSASNYDPSYVPFNFNSAAEKDDYIGCQNSLEEFDTAYWTLENEMAKSVQNGGNWTRSSFRLGAVSDKQVYVFDVWVNTFFEMKRNGELGFSQCIQEYPDYLEEKEEAKTEKLDLKARAAARDCDFYEIESLPSSALSPYRDQVDVCYAQVAVEACDMDEIDDFSNSLRMKFYDEVIACEQKENEPELVVMEPVSIPEPVVAEPVIAPYVPPTPPVQVQQTIKDVVVEELDSVVEEDMSTSTEATSTEKIIEVTQEELDRMVEEKLNEKLNEVQSDPEPEEKPSFFKRITNFLFGWMF